MKQTEPTTLSSQLPTGFPGWNFTDPESQQNFLNPWSNFATQGLQSALFANAELLNSTIRFNQELVRFMNHRISEDMSLAGQVVTNQLPNSLLKVYSDFLSTASKEYADEMQKIVSMFSQASAPVLPNN